MDFLFKEAVWDKFQFWYFIGKQLDILGFCHFYFKENLKIILHCFCCLFPNTKLFELETTSNNYQNFYYIIKIISNQ